jgi:hypothetical protein
VNTLLRYGGNKCKILAVVLFLFLGTQTGREKECNTRGKRDHLIAAINIVLSNVGSIRQATEFYSFPKIHYMTGSRILKAGKM